MLDVTAKHIIGIWIYLLLGAGCDNLSTCKSLLAQSRSITDDKNAELNEEDPEATADKRGAGAAKRQRAAEDSESLPSTKEKKKAR